jgi:hypothetical protein
MPTIAEVTERLKAHNEWGAMLHVIQRKNLWDHAIASALTREEATEQDRTLAAELLQLTLEERQIAWDRAHRPNLIAETVDFLKRANAHGAMYVVVTQGNMDRENIIRCARADDATAHDKALAWHLLDMAEPDRCTAWDEAFGSADDGTA